MYCRFCGKEVDINDAFCMHCGKSTAEAKEYYDIDTNNSEQDYSLTEQLVGPKSEYYLPRFEKLRQSKTKISFNWSGFFFGTLWMVYRKMYLTAAIVMVVNAVLCIVIDSSVGAATVAFCHILGNYIYMLRIDKLAQKAQSMDVDEREKFIRKKGGTSKTATAIVAVVMALFTVVTVAAYVLAAFNVQPA